MFSQVIFNVFKDFNSNNVKYCHWKSTDHLEASFMAETDLDVLVSAQSFSIVEPILIKRGFVRCRTPSLRTYPAVEDYVFFDYKLSKWIHFHLHYGLPCGDRWVKSYHLPIEKYLVDKRIFIEKYKMYNIDPISEYLMFIYRMHMKWRNPDNKSSVLKENTFLVNYLSDNGFDQNIFNEAIKVHPLYDESQDEYIRNWFCKNPSKNSFYSRLKFKRFLKKYRGMSEVTFNFLNFLRFYYRVIIEARRRFFNKKNTGRRQLVTGGKLVVFVGMDGAGKTSMIEAVFNQFSKQINVQKVFLGTGRSGAGWIRFVGFKLFGTKDYSSKKSLELNNGAIIKSKFSILNLIVNISDYTRRKP